MKASNIVMKWKNSKVEWSSLCVMVSIGSVSPQAQVLKAWSLLVVGAVLGDCGNIRKWGLVGGSRPFKVVSCPGPSSYLHLPASMRCVAFGNWILSWTLLPVSACQPPWDGHLFSTTSSLPPSTYEAFPEVHSNKANQLRTETETNSSFEVIFLYPIGYRTL